MNRDDYKRFLDSLKEGDKVIYMSWGKYSEETIKQLLRYDDSAIRMSFEGTSLMTVYDCDNQNLMPSTPEKLIEVTHNNYLRDNPVCLKIYSGLKNGEMF